MTHSHEVSNLARGIGTRLVFNHKKDIFGDLDSDCCLERDIPALLAVIGLAHDLGNPPFGHQGEAAIGDWFEKHLELFNQVDNKEIYNDFFKFDGNAQTIRLVTKLQILNDKFGLNLTYSTLAAMIKYPRSSYSHEKSIWAKHGYFFSEDDIIKDIWAETGLNEGERHPLTYLMEACDDIAYLVLDAEDTVKKGLASFHDLIDCLECWQKKNNVEDPFIERVVYESKRKNEEYTKENLSPSELNDMSMQMFRFFSIAYLVDAVVDEFKHNISSIMSGAESVKDLISISKAVHFCKALKEFDKTRGYQHKSVLKLELEGFNYIQGVMDMLWIGIHGALSKTERHSADTPFGKYAYGRISENYRRVFQDENDLTELYKECQLLTDAVSGMTDSYIMALHDELKELYHYERCKQ